jgi:hypothetical protein
MRCARRWVSEGPYRYRSDILKALERYGVQPTAQTPPALVHEFVRDLYRVEIRRLRERLLRGEFPRRDYAGRVVELRRKYWVTSVRAAEWVE